MKKVFLTLLLLVVFACKNETKGDPPSKNIDVEVSESIILPNHPLWLLNSLELEETSTVYKKSQVFKLNRTSTKETAYASVNNIDVTFGSNHKVSVIVKQATIGELFGLRIIGNYPNRVDAVFNLKNGSLKEVVDVGEFLEGNANIEPLGGGWYKCSITAEVNADKIKIILGPTTELRKTIAWEASTSEECNNYIVPSSLTLEELSN